MICKHCKKKIKKDTMFYGWIHEESESYTCDSQNSYLAEPMTEFDEKEEESQ